MRKWLKPGVHSAFHEHWVRGYGLLYPIPIVLYLPNVNIAMSILGKKQFT